MKSRQKLEMTWVGKDERPRLEPRVLVEDPAKSYGDPKAENMLIFGDNLLALKALEQDFAGKIKCIYIDPPFNTGAAFEHYDDGVEHSVWLSLMWERFNLLRGLLSNDGLLLVHLDDSEMAYTKVVLDEVFGRFNYCNTISMTTNDPSGFKATGATVFSTANYLLVYAKDKTTKPIKKVYIEKAYDTSYSKVLVDRSRPYTEWEWEGIADVVARELGLDSVRSAKRELGDAYGDEVARYAVQNADRVFQTAAIGGGAAIKRQDTIRKSMSQRDKVFVHPGEDMPDFFILNGRQILFYDKRLVEVDGRKVPAEVVTDVWTDISWNGISNEGGVEFKNGKKPELLVKRILDMATNPGDLVLDSFAGSGTTGAVAHKMGRRWIMVELGEHCHTHIIPRMKKVIDGTDQGGISEAVGWKGGGGFKYYRLAESLLVRDKDLSTREHPVYIINPRYNETMLIRGICRIAGFKYRNDGRLHGISSENRFLHVTTRLLTQLYLDSLAEDIDRNQSLVIYCTRRVSNLNVPDNIEIRKIPRDLLEKCDFEEDK